MVEITKKDMLDTLSEFYGKFIEPEFRSIHNKLDEHDQKFKDILEHFDKIYTKLDRLGRNVSCKPGLLPEPRGTI